MRLVLPAALLILSTVVAACGGGGSATPTPFPTAVPFDVNLLSGMVLGPEDVPNEPPQLGVFAPGERSVVSFTSSYGNDSYYLQSTVGHYGDPAWREQSIEDVRRGLVYAMKSERNHALDSAERAYVYRYLEGTPASAVFAIKGDFWVLVQAISRDGTREADVFDDVLMDGYASLSLSRIESYLTDPSSIQPAPWAVRFESPTPAPPMTATPTP